MKNIHQIKKNWKNSFETQTEISEQHGYRNVSQSPYQAANRSSFLKEDYNFHSSVSQGPPPSFLVKTPLGTPHEDTVEIAQKFEMLAKNQKELQSPHYLAPKTILEQENEVVALVKEKDERLQKLKILKGAADKNGMVHRWIYKEVRLSMSKMSIMSTVLGLLFLGALFFIIGFLTAVTTLKAEESQHNSQSAWLASNNPEQQHAGKGGALGTIATRVGGNYVGGALRKEFSPLGKALGTASAIVPAPLQPFARYGIGTARANVQSATRAVNPFATRRGQPQESSYGGNPQPMAMGQQYAGPQGQQYMSSGATPVGYQQPIGSAPSAYYGQGYGPAQQQPLMQQPIQQPMQQPMQQPTQQPYYYPLSAPPQFLPPQQMMAPAQGQIMVQQVMPQPQYAQQIVPQPGYYR
ncbi:MAG: hypothetical protein FJX03_02220 [Alphaproteobacteria bacterium]|nr:hypothetical protein [Alphaproteobacteria bacterium]